MNERIKKLRKTLDLTQQEFSNCIGCSRNLVANYEIGNRNPSSSVINNICKTFHVSETWLRTGVGEMFDQTEETAVGRLCAELHASELESGIIRAYFRIDSRIREPFMQRLIQEMQNEYATVAPSSAETDKTEGARAEEQKTPIHVSEDGQNELNETALTVFQGLNPDQKQYFLDLMQGMIEP